MSLKIKTNQIDKRAILEVCGLIDANSAPKFARSLENLSNNYNTESIIIDCSYLKSINSAGLTVLANILDQNQNIKISMQNTPVAVSELLNLCGFNKFINIYTRGR